ncbi:MAG TPA: Ig-like domain-containing protein [Puia sp.]
MKRNFTPFLHGSLCRVRYLTLLLLFLLFDYGNLFAQVSPAHVVVGYWQNWGATTDSPPYIPLRNIDSRYNVIDIAFAGTNPDFATLNFAPANGTVAAFQSDVQFLQSQGKKVLLSIGGQNGTLTLTSTAQKQAFITSLEALLDQYNFDGFDLDLEGGTTLQLDNGDNNFMSPTTPKVVNLISAAQQVISYRQAQGKTCWLTMAPETFYVETAYANAYSPLVGAYLPIIYGLRNQLTFLQPQFYNTGSVTGLDGKNYSEATPDFTVAMAEMLLTGFAVNGLNGGTQVFPALRPDQVAFGLPATPAAAPSGGYYSPAGVTQALNYLTKGQSFGGTYKLKNPAGYPGLRGVMNWSINWDQSGGYAFAANIYNFFFGSTPGNTPPTVSLTSPAANASFTAPATVTLQATAADADGTVTKVEFFNGSASLGVVTTAPYSFTWSNVAAGAYTLTVVATDNGGATTTSTAVSITVNNSTGGSTGNCAGIATWSASAVYTAGNQVVYNGNLYSAKWWTQGNQPDINTGSGLPWTLVGACSGTTPPGNTPPTVSITSPAANASFTAPASITLQATAADADGTVAKVEFFNGSASLGAVTTAPYTLTWSNVAAGTYNLTAKATDNGGATTTSAAISIQVTSSSSGGNCAGVPTYQPYPAVYNIGDKVVYNGKLYQSTSNGLYNVTPGTADWWWTPLGACTAGAVNAASTSSGSALQPTVANQQKGLIVYPNPVTGTDIQVQLTAYAGEKVSISISSVAGDAPVLHQELVAAGQGAQLVRLDLTHLPAGIWILSVKHPVTGRVETAKVIRL